MWRKTAKKIECYCFQTATAFNTACWLCGLNISRFNGPPFADADLPTERGKHASRLDEKEIQRIHRMNEIHVCCWPFEVLVIEIEFNRNAGRKENGEE